MMYDTESHEYILHFFCGKNIGIPPLDVRFDREPGNDNYYQIYN